MKTLGMKLEWEKFKTVMYTNKTSDPASYQTWSKNLSLVLVTIFEAVKTDLQNAGVTVQLTNGTQNFASVQEAVAALPIFA